MAQRIVMQERAARRLSLFPSLFTFRRAFPVLVLLALACGMVWAKRRDAFHREEFKLKTFSGAKVRGYAVVPKPVQPRPVIVYLHGSGGRALNNGREMRQMAELGFAVVTLDYNQGNQEQFNLEMVALQEYLADRRWANTNAIAWVGFSLGAQQMLSFGLEHPDRLPHVLVRLGGGWVEELNGNPSDNTSGASGREVATGRTLPVRGPVLIVHGEKDRTFPLADVKRLEEWMRSQGLRVEERILTGAGHGLHEDKPVVIRAIAEYCAEWLKPPTRLRVHAIPTYWAYWIPVFAWLGAWAFVTYRQFRAWINAVPAPPSRLQRMLNIVAWITASAAVAVSAFHLGWPRLTATPQNIQVAARRIAPPVARNEAAYLATLPIWGSHTVRAALNHAELPNFRGPFLYQKLETSLFHQYIVSPVVDETSLAELNWRRPLWEIFYPRIRHETDPVSAAHIVVRFLRERVGIHPGYAQNTGVETIWREQFTDATGWERIYVAALRAAGVAARLDTNHRAEIWTGDKWQPAPRPLIETMLPGNTGQP